MCNFKDINLYQLAGILVLILPQFSVGAISYEPFVVSQYDPEKFKISKVEIRNGNSLIRLIAAKNVSEKHDKPPYLCRAWFDVIKANQTIFSKFFDDIDAVGFSFGLFIPKLQPPPPYFAVVKNGDYDGRLFLVNENGEVFDLIGGFYFISENKKFLFSHYASDTSGLAVFDLLEGLVVFSSDRLPAYQHQWYKYDDSYFFTASEWLDSSGMPDEKKNVGYFYDFTSQEIVEKIMTRAELGASEPIKFDFDPRDYDNCDNT